MRKSVASRSRHQKTMKWHKPCADRAFLNRRDRDDHPTIKEQLADVRYEEWEGLKEVLAQDERAGVHRLLEQKERQFQRDKARRDDYIRRQSFERALWATGLTRVAGVDEVGRGPLAGRHRGAVVLPLDFYHDG